MHALRRTAGVIGASCNGVRMTGKGKPADMALESETFRAEARALYVLATPIGNLRDLTLRALDILRSVDAICAEDTRVTAALLTRYGITTRPRAFHRHNEAREIPGILQALAEGHSVALVSDAGTPAISDPGARLVRAVVEAGYRVVPIPGASAVAAAVSAAGLAAERFVFIGFLPMQAKARRSVLDAFGALPAALVLFEAPHRIVDTVGALAQAIDARRTIVIAREITKAFETFARMPLADAPAWLAADANRTRGEFVLIVDAPLPEGASAALPAEARRLLAALLDELPPARAARVAAHAMGLPRDLLYDHALALKGAGDR